MKELKHLLINLLVVLVFKVSPIWHLVLAFVAAFFGEFVLFWVLLPIAVVTPWLAIPFANKKPEWFELFYDLINK